jgi:hypothetical protein
VREETEREEKVIRDFVLNGLASARRDLRLAQSAIEQSADQIRMSVQDLLLRVDGIDGENGLIQELRSLITQTASDITFEFIGRLGILGDGLSASLADITDSFAPYRAYIRFGADAEGRPTILLGKSDSPMTLAILNDRISFSVNGAEIAYFSGAENALDADSVFVSERLFLGNFGFVVEPDGGLSFKKVR